MHLFQDAMPIQLFSVFHGKKEMEQEVGQVLIASVFQRHYLQYKINFKITNKVHPKVSGANTMLYSLIQLFCMIFVK